MTRRPDRPRTGGTIEGWADEPEHEPDPGLEPVGTDLPGGEDERRRVAELLGREPRCPVEVVRRCTDGTPSVIGNGPLLDDGTPMPTMYWLVDPALRDAVSRLEAEGGVRAAEAAVDEGALARAHRHYAETRDALLQRGYDGPRPSGGVGGTRQGVKCLHAHLAWWLVGGDDPVGEWTAVRLGIASPEGRSG